MSRRRRPLVNNGLEAAPEIERDCKDLQSDFRSDTKSFDVDTIDERAVKDTPATRKSRFDVSATA